MTRQIGLNFLPKNGSFGKMSGSTTLFMSRRGNLYCNGTYRVSWSWRCRDVILSGAGQDPLVPTAQWRFVLIPFFWRDLVFFGSVGAFLAGLSRLVVFFPNFLFCCCLFFSCLVLSLDLNTPFF